MMKVVHISTYDYGGAGLAAYRLHRGLLAHGVESHMLVAHKTTLDETVIQAEPDKCLLYQPPKNAIIRKYKKTMRRHGKYLTHYEHVQHEIERLNELHPSVFFTSPVSTYEISIHPLLQDADIIHLHWIQDFVNFETFFCRINKPIVWTLHDLNPMYGGFHHTLWKERYYEEYKVLEDEFYNTKKQAIKYAKNLAVVAISKQMHNLISCHEFFLGRPVFDIYNSIDGNRFMLLNRKDVRKLLSIHDNSNVFLFSNKNLNDEAKGLRCLVKALDKLQLKDTLLICLGNGIIPKSSFTKIRHFLPISDSEWLSQLYSAANFLVLPSLQEGLSQTLLESLCCGTPVISTPVSGSEDIVNEHNGVCCSGFSPESIADGITVAMKRTYNRTKLRDDVIERFGIEKIVGENVKMYKSLMAQ